MLPIDGLLIYLSLGLFACFAVVVSRLTRIARAIEASNAIAMNNIHQGNE